MQMRYNLWQKNQMRAHYRKQTFFFYLGITVCTINTNEYTIKQVSSTNRIPLSIKRYDLHSFPFVVQGKSEGDIFTQFWRKFENITGIEVLLCTILDKIYPKDKHWIFVHFLKTYHERYSSHGHIFL